MIGEILNAHRMQLDHARRLVTDVGASQMTAQPGNQRDHAAWTLGHIVFSLQSLGEEIGHLPWLGASWKALFEPGSRPTSSASDYPKKMELLIALADAEERVRDRLKGFTASKTSLPLPDVRYRDRLPTIGHCLVHILVGHTAHHIGRLAAWRAGVGLPPIADPLSLPA